MAKKKAVKKAKQLPLVAKEVKSGGRKPNVKFVSLTVMAVIPTQQYGNIQPKIEVQADNYEDARAFVMPLIEQLYAQYTESKPGFLGRIQVTEKVVTPPTAAQTAAPAPQATAQAAATTANTTAPAKPKSEAVIKAETALRLAATEDAATRIQDQIEKSTKIAAEDKPDLLKLCLVRRGELSKAQ